MLFVFGILITIGDLKLNFVNELTIRSSWKEMTSTAVIKLSKRVLVKTPEGNLVKIQDLIKVGDPVKIEFGYNGVFEIEFVGYVAKSPRIGLPIEIHCEDEMFNLKRKVINQRIVSGKLSALIGSMLPGYQFEVLDTELGSGYSILSEATGSVAGALKRVEDTFGLKSFFRLKDGAPVLIVGKPYSSIDIVSQPTIKYHLKVNTKADSVSMIFKDDEPIQVRGIVKVDNGRDLKSNYPAGTDFQGSYKTIHYTVKTQSELDAAVKEDFEKINQDRIEGNVTGFAVPFARHGMVANIVDDTYNVIDSSNYIDTVEVSIDVNGGVQRVCSLGYVANSETIKISS
jgi:hypothetical protein